MIQLDEAEAIQWALDNAQDNGLVVILPESVSQAISLISSRGPVSEGFSLTAAAEEEPLVFPPVGAPVNKAMSAVGAGSSSSDTQALNGAAKSS